MQSLNHLQRQRCAQADRDRRGRLPRFSGVLKKSSGPAFEITGPGILGTGTTVIATTETATIPATATTAGEHVDSVAGLKTVDGPEGGNHGSLPMPTR